MKDNFVYTSDEQQEEVGYVLDKTNKQKAKEFISNAKEKVGDFIENVGEDAVTGFTIGVQVTAIIFAVMWARGAKKDEKLLKQIEKTCYDAGHYFGYHSGYVKGVLDSHSLPVKND